MFKKSFITLAITFGLTLGVAGTAQADDMPAVPMPSGPDCISWLNYGPLYFDWEQVEEGCNTSFGWDTPERAYVTWLERYLQNYTEFQPIQEEWMDSQDAQIADQESTITRQQNTIKRQRAQIIRLRHRLAHR